MSIFLQSFNRGVQGNPQTLFKMPGGEWHIKSETPWAGDQWALVRWGNGDELMALAIWADAVHRDGGTPRVVIPYLPGARQDRRKVGEALSSKIYADMINSCELALVVCLDPHSDVMPALLNNCRVIDSASLVVEALRHQAPDDAYAGIIAPDAGAYKRAERVATEMKLPLFQATKVRDSASGRLSDFKCEGLPEDKILVVVDDICDGGRTFVGLARATGIPKGRLFLWVTHGVFSAGSRALVDYYSAIMTTDSHEGTQVNDAEERWWITKVFPRLTRI